MRYSFAFLLVAAGLAYPAIAQELPSSADKEPAQEKKICRKVATTGSILGGKKECHTKKEWIAISDAQRDQRERRTTGGVIGRSE